MTIKLKSTNFTETCFILYSLLKTGCGLGHNFTGLKDLMVKLLKLYFVNSKRPSLCFQVLSVQCSHPDPADDDLCSACSLDGLHLVRHRVSGAAGVHIGGGRHVAR